MPPLAAAIAAFHTAAERRSDHGGKSGMAWVVDGNAAGFAEYGTGVLDQAACRRLTKSASAVLDTCGGLLDERRRSGFVRLCHGDLHLRNVVLLDGRPTLFDGVEFNDLIACTDVLYDVAFLLMDLWRRDLPRHASVAWNRCLGDTGDLGGLSLLPLFLSCRAAVRAKTSATASRLERDGQRRGQLEKSRVNTWPSRTASCTLRVQASSRSRVLGHREVDAGCPPVAIPGRRAWRDRDPER